jgi:NAD(P)-dependent dehydrogenase (short-subunit alcohol dehydrogenase family)
LGTESRHAAAEDEFREIFAVNTAAAFFTIQRAIRHLNHAHQSCSPDSRR